MINEKLIKQFEKIIEIKNIDLKIIEKICKEDANILRPILGVCYEEYFKKKILQLDINAEILDGIGDSDVDVNVNGFNLQLKTPDTGSTKMNKCVGVALHKTHGLEKRPHNLYKKNNKTFDFLVVKHPNKGSMIIPFENIPESNSWENYLADPARFEWENEFLNRWDFLNLNIPSGKDISYQIDTGNSALPFLSSLTNLHDFEILETLCKPEYFRAAVMGLKGNLKEEWFKALLLDLKYELEFPHNPYFKYDIILHNKQQRYRIQVKGTSKNMCTTDKGIIGFELMGSHGQFPKRGYRKQDLDYIALIISEDQIPSEFNFKGLNFIIIPIDDMPLHYLIGKGDNHIESGFGNKKWNEEEFKDVLYPNIKLKFINEGSNVFLIPDINSYKKYKGYDTLPHNSNFKKPIKYILNKLPKEFNN